ncbi:transcriptional regulator, luxR family [Burkholderiales bacterium JOSHI_001]|nr:transcriptional regulator, luxR family [Burkholderiales bacterium JOSHI_001]
MGQSQEAFGPDADAADTGALLERDAELAHLTACVAALRLQPESGRCVVVHGEAGVGKTSLLRQLRRQAGADVQWLWGQGEPMHAAPALAPLIELLDALPPGLASQVRAGRLNADVLGGLLALLRERARPVVLVIDDLQWADSATLDLLGYAARRIASTRALLVVAYRDEEQGPAPVLQGWLARLPRHATTRLGLLPLSMGAVEAMAARAGRPAKGLYRATQGNPFFLAELLAAPEGRLPHAVRDAVLARAALLTAAARDVLDLVALAPFGLEASVIDALLEDSPAAVDEALGRKLLCSDEGRLRFRHELARVSVEEAIPAGRAADLHLALLDVLTQHGAPPVRLLHHAERGGLWTAVVRLAPHAAAQASAASAYRQAADHLALALREAHRLDPATEAALRVSHAQACAACSRLEDALQARRRSLALHRQLGELRQQGEDLRDMARLHWYRGEITLGTEQAAQAVALFESLGDKRELASSCAVMAQLHLLDEAQGQAAHWAARALALFEALGDEPGVGHALNTLGFAELVRDDRASSWALLDRSLAIARRNGLDEDVARAYVNLASLCLVHRRLDALASWVEEGLVHCEACDQDMRFARLCVRGAYGAMERGEWARSLALLDRMTGLPTTSPLEAEQARHVRALIGLRRGEADYDSHWTAMVEGRRLMAVDPWYAPQAVARAEAAWLRGDHDAVARVALEALPGALRSGERWRIGQLAVWLARVGRLPAGFNAPVSPPAAASLTGDVRGAAQAWAGLGCRYDQALALMAGNVEDLREALQLLDALGAAPAARLARRRLRLAGIDEVGRGPNRHARCDPLGLTARERQVLDLLALGLSNRAIALKLHRSERTVEHHVAALLAKLGVPSREAAVARARQAPEI